MKKTTAASHEAIHQTVPLKVETICGEKSIQIDFTDQRLTAHGGLALMSSFLHRLQWRQKLAAALPHRPTSPNAFAPVDIALGFMAGVWTGADKFSRVGQLCGDPVLPQVLGVEAIPSQPTLTRFFAQFTRARNECFAPLYRLLLGRLPSEPGGYTLDLDSTAIIHKDGHQEGVRLGHTPRGPRPCHHPLIAALAEPRLVCNYWLRSGNTGTICHARGFIDATLAQLPSQVRVGLVRADSGFYSHEFFDHLEARGLDYIVVAQLSRGLKPHFQHDEAAWVATELPGFEVQEIDTSVLHWRAPRRRLILIRQRITERPSAGGKTLLEVPGYRFQALCTSLPRSWSPLAVWRRYKGRADVENRIKELAAQYGLKSFCCRSFWGTEAAGQLAILCYNLCVLFQRQLGRLEGVQLDTLRFRLFTRAAAWSHPAGRATLKLAVPPAQRGWWRTLLEKLTSELPPFNCNSVGSLAA